MHTSKSAFWRKAQFFSISEASLDFGLLLLQANAATAENHAWTSGTAELRRACCSNILMHRCNGLQHSAIIEAVCRVGVNLFQINSKAVGGQYAAPLLLGISKRSLLEGAASTPAYAAYSGWHADSMFSLVPAKTQVDFWSILPLWTGQMPPGCLLISIACYGPMPKWLIWHQQLPSQASCRRLASLNSTCEYHCRQASQRHCRPGHADMQRLEGSGLTCRERASL